MSTAIKETSTNALNRRALGCACVMNEVLARVSLRWTWLGHVVVVSASDEAALAVPKQVAAIFVVDELEPFWRSLEPQTTVLQPLWDVPTGRAFVVRHPDGRAVEYLELRASA